MKIRKLHEINFDADETIMTATISQPDEIVMLMSSGNVVRFNLNEKKGMPLFSVKSNTVYSDGGFDITAKSSIYTLDDIVVVVNDYKCHGFIHYPGKYRNLHLLRDDYHAEISCYPIALFKNEAGVPHIIYGVAWNHVQIMNLDTLQILTASKSLIAENAEERHIELHKRYPEDNKLPWPRPYDYFYGELLLSPDQQKFLSAGWVWGSADCYNVYDIKHFISSNRIAGVWIGTWEHQNRAACWIDNETIAVAYNPFIDGDGDENATEDSPCEIHFYKLKGNSTETGNDIQIAGNFKLQSYIHYNRSIDAFIAFSHKTGLSVISMDGQIAYKDENLKVSQYDIRTGLLLETGKKTVRIYEIGN